MSTPVRQAALDNRSKQLNPSHPSYHLSRGLDDVAAQAQASQQSRALDSPGPAPAPNEPSSPVKAKAPAKPDPK
jgi:hypothetical protein